MKTIKIISILFALCLINSGAFAQDCALTIYDSDNTSGAYYSGYIQLWDYSSTPATQLSNEYFTNEYYSTSGVTNNIALSYQVVPDVARLKFFVYAVNLSTSRSNTAWSAQYFDSYDYYYNHPPVNLSIQ